MESILHTSKSRHMLGFNSVTNHGKLRTEDYLQILSCFPPKTLEKLDRVRDWTGVTKEFVEEIFCECLEVYVEYKDVRGRSYLKIICLIKEEWINLFNKLNEFSGVDSHVRDFAEKVQENLKTLSKDEYYVAFYVGETIQTFQARMCGNYPIEFLTPFPATHVFKLCQVKDGTRKDLCKYSSYTIEAFIAVWLESKLGNISHFSGHFMNLDPCGFRNFLGAYGGENSTAGWYVQTTGGALHVDERAKYKRRR
jgi:hypothetical protein